VVNQLQGIKDNGYSILLRDGEFYIDPADNNAANIMLLASQLKDEFVAARSLMYRAYDVAGDDRKIWVKLLESVRRAYQFEPDQTAGSRILLWISNNLSRANGIYRKSRADEAFHKRVIERLEPKMPMALVEDKRIARALERRLEKLNSSNADDKVNPE